MFKKIPDTKTLEALLRAWHSKRAMTNFFLPEEEYLPVAKKWMVMRFEHGCYLIFEKKEHYDFYFFLEKGTLPVAVPEISVDLMSRDGLTAVVRFLVRDFVIWMRFLEGMIVWWRRSARLVRSFPQILLQ